MYIQDLLKMDPRGLTITRLAIGIGKCLYRCALAVSKVKWLLDLFPLRGMAIDLFLGNTRLEQLFLEALLALAWVALLGLFFFFFFPSRRALGFFVLVFFFSTATSSFRRARFTRPCMRQLRSISGSTRYYGS
jgi:hypothetical protein